MSESYREQFPLLCDDLSDEEHYSPQYHRQYRQMTYRGRSRNNLKGAVAIIKRWPEHWSSFLTYWWVGVVMICLMTFILYNSLFALSILPTAHLKPMKSKVPSVNAQHLPHEILAFSNVYMHLFTENDKDDKVIKYLPHIEAMASKHPTFIYHLVMVVNDTSTDYTRYNAEENNVNALNSLWSTDIVKTGKTAANNIRIKYISLTKYLDNSPLSKYWRMLPSQLIEFFVRAVSIWDKGGITINPMILIPMPSNSAYIKEIDKTFESFRYSEMTKPSLKTTKQPLRVDNPKFKQKVNNIRDIINTLENDNNINIGPDEILIEAESKNLGYAAVNAEKSLKTDNSITIKSVKKRSTLVKSLSNENNTETTQTIQTLSNSNTSSLTMLPSFLEYLFHHNAINHDREDSNIKNTKNDIKYGSSNKVLNTDSVLESKNITNSFTKNISNIDQRPYVPMIIPAKGLKLPLNKTGTDVLQEYGNKNVDQQLTIDLKGNLLATKTACHAFLGTIFTDAIHCGHDETISDFLIKELSIFCKGVLSSCSGINLIIL